MGSDIVLVLLGAWIHQAIRVAVMIFFPPQALARATQSDRLRIAGFAARQWSDGLDNLDRESLQSLKKRVFWNFYILLLVPMAVLLGYVFFFSP